MQRVWITLLSAFLLAAGAASGQTTQTRIFTEPAGASFFVDGTKYTSSATFFWPKGSRHTVWVVSTQYTGDSTKMEFGGWSDDKTLLSPGASPAITVTADPDFLSLKATFVVTHRIDVLWYNILPNPLPETAILCESGGRPGNHSAGNILPVPATAPPVGTPAPPSVTPNAPPSSTPVQTVQPGFFMVPGPGALYINGTCVANSLSIWLPQSSVITFNAFPARGFVFEGWQVDGRPHTDSFLRTYTVIGPAVVSPRFAPAKRVAIQTEPYGLDIMVDRTRTPTRFPEEIELRYRDSGNIYPIPPWEFDFAEGSSHILGAPPTQLDLTGKTWILDSFSIGGGEGTIFKAVGANTPQIITARFVRGAGVSFLTNPVGLKLNVDGREWPSYNFVWGVGTKHTVTAPALVTDTRGRKYRFLGWAHGGDATQQVTTPEESELGGLRMVANYELLPRVVISTTQPGSRLQVDGTLCPLPCVLDRPVGTTVALSVPESVALGSDSRIQFDGWSDSATPSRTVSFGAADQQLSFRYRTFNRFQALADPAEGATFRLEPASADGFYPNDVTVQVTAVAVEGFRFRRWEGDLSGTSAGGFLSMLVPRLVRAQLDKVPFIPSSGIRNAAGETPTKAVAPGSIVSIFGTGLANDYVAGANGPLTQTLGNVTARIGTRLLPLLFVSPEQVNAYLPSDLADGEYTLGVRNGSLPEIAGKLTIVRNAPGIFGQMIGEQFVATAQRPDGSLAAPDRPAQRGEQIVLMGTGFGAYQRGILDGFPAVENQPNPLRTLPQIVAGDQAYTVDFAGAAPGLVGVTIIRFTVPASWTPGTVELRVRQGEVESNRVLLPVE